MRHLVFIFISFFISFVTKAQQIELLGTYTAGFLGTESIRFVGTDSFYFSGFYCNYGVHGKGVCEIVDERLYLYFENSGRKRQKDLMKVPVISRLGNADRFAHIKVKCVDGDGEPIFGATVEVLSAGKIVMGYATDTAGVAMISAAFDKFPVQLRATALGVEKEIVQIDSAADYAVQIFHRDNELADVLLDKGQEYVFEIRQLDRDLIIMRKPPGKGQFYKYKKHKD